jgi:predicted nucleic-acid-binding Zn-ribbon protein
VKLDEQLATRFVCTKCKGQGGSTKKISTSGSGLSRLMDIQHNKFITVSCNNCGYTEMYNPEVLEGKSQLGNILDVLFG